MGCRKELNVKLLPFEIENVIIQSMTAVINIDSRINLTKMSIAMGRNCLYEPEIFPALRYIKYNPLCINIFTSGKVIILGLRSLDQTDLITEIKSEIAAYAWLTL
jgi:TATA-box binding protein (TBP) (component of TFIID and TFIIIB)